MVSNTTDLSDSPEFADIKSIAHEAVHGYELAEFDEVFICYNRFVNALTQIPTVERLLPMETPEVSASEGLTASYEYEPSPGSCA